VFGVEVKSRASQLDSPGLRLWVDLQLTSLQRHDCTLAENAIMPEYGASDKDIKYVPPAPELLEQIARGVCKKLAELDPSFEGPEIIYEFSAFLNIMARMHANRLNRLKSSTGSNLLDSAN
jgi:hypothetical protein